jgi:cysteinyl-tRNA synthetase
MPDDTLSTYSSGRFLYNEVARLRERHVRFDVVALETAIAKHVGHGNVKSLVKLSDGGFNRVLLATMDDGFRAIVKIPSRISVPMTYATASEVATLTFLRSKGFPVPEVYGWSSTTENVVGVEYIIMENASGLVRIHACSTR